MMKPTGCQFSALDEESVILKIKTLKFGVKTLKKIKCNQKLTVAQKPNRAAHHKRNPRSKTENHNKPVYCVCKSGGTTSGSAVSAPGRRRPTSHTPATSAGNATRYPPQRRRAPTGARSAPRWPRAPGLNLSRARTEALKRRLCTSASGAHTPPHTNARAPRAPPPCGSTCTCGTARLSDTCRTCSRPDPNPPPRLAEPAAPSSPTG